ncbi:hypothetical protein F0M18_12315 [Pseudohalioglobus sediminis]|uniref:Uncharacterized protein n=1 Tax=Pseudohalioglobus sediminis TaxID=2606449 RepID=A0A5B0WW20_9GAMM|nr:hypothetical protein [Pseudohalioglobus sediminis]KAA1190588.1 hypothetical protein F0M18_12315 [Pseudohalioglobus sediminis]
MQPFSLICCYRVVSRGAIIERMVQVTPGFNSGAARRQLARCVAIYGGIGFNPGYIGIGANTGGDAFFPFCF